MREEVKNVTIVKTFRGKKSLSEALDYLNELKKSEKIFEEPRLYCKFKKGFEEARVAFTIK